MNGNGKKLNLQTVLLLATLAFLLIDKIVIPNVNSGELARQLHAQDLRITTLEECILQLRPLPVQVAEIRALLTSHMTTDKEKR